MVPISGQPKALVAKLAGRLLISGARFWSCRLACALELCLCRLNKLTMLVSLHLFSADYFSLFSLNESYYLSGAQRGMFVDQLEQAGRNFQLNWAHLFAEQACIASFLKLSMFERP